MAKKVTNKGWGDIGVNVEELSSFDLPDKYKCFAYHYVMSSDKGRFNAGEAARRAGYSGKTHAADTQANRMLKNVELKRFIGFVTLKQLEPLKDKFRSDVIDLALSITNARLEHYVNQDGTPAFSSWEEVDSRAVKSIISKPGKFGNIVEIKLHDPKDWVLILDKYMDLAAKADITIDIKKETDLDAMTDEQLIALMDQRKDKE